MAELNADSGSPPSEGRPAGTSASSVEFPFLKNTLQIFLGLVAFYLLMSFLLPDIGSREAGPVATCKNNLSNIGKALHNYQQDFGCLPPAYVVDTSGRPMHSWRALLLPQLEATAIYQLYRFDEPWDSTSNNKLRTATFPTWHCPSDESPRSEVSYLAVVDKHAAWNGTQSRRSFDLSPNTILLIEVRGANVPWLEPRDLTPDGVRRLFRETRSGDRESSHRGGCHVLLADFTVRFIPDDVAPAVLDQILSIEPEGDDFDKRNL
jgi:hypothetical protein